MDGLYYIGKVSKLERQASKEEDKVSDFGVLTVLIEGYSQKIEAKFDSLKEFVIGKRYMIPVFFTADLVTDKQTGDNRVVKRLKLRVNGRVEELEDSED